MDSKIYDVIILGAWPSWLFCASKINKWKSILVLEKSDSPAQKLLLSAKWRWNITNININPAFDYIADNSQFVIEAFKKYWAKDFINEINDIWIGIKEENNWRILLESGKVSLFHDKLVLMVKEKWVDIHFWENLISVNKSNDLFEVNTSKSVYKSKFFIVATGGPSFPNLWATGVAIDIAKIFNVTYKNFYPALVWLETQQDFSSLSWSSVVGNLSLLKSNQTVYHGVWPILFTHRWISWPIVFNSSLVIEDTNNKYKIKLSISSSEITKRLLSFLWFHTNKLNNYIITSNIVGVRWLNEAKVCWWGILTSNLNYSFECKDCPWLYFIGECVNVTWKTGWFNLQWCWTSSSICADSINKKK